MNTPLAADGEPDDPGHSHHWTDSAGRLVIPAVPGAYTLEPRPSRSRTLVEPCPKITVTDGNYTELTLVVQQGRRPTLREHFRHAACVALIPVVVTTYPRPLAYLRSP